MFCLKKTDSDLHFAQDEPFKPLLLWISRFSTGYPYCDGKWRLRRKPYSCHSLHCFQLFR